MRNLLLAAAVAVLPSTAVAADGVPDSLIAQLRADLQKPVTLIMLRAQNENHAALTQARIEELDQIWRAEHDKSEQPLMAQLMGNPLTTYLSRLQAQSSGLLVEIFVMDNKGLNVGLSSITSDYWQGDEAKFQKTFDLGPQAVFIDEIETHEATGQNRRQVNFTLTDPTTGESLGAATVEINVDELERRP